MNKWPTSKSCKLFEGVKKEGGKPCAGLQEGGILEKCLPLVFFCRRPLAVYVYGLSLITKILNFTNVGQVPPSKASFPKRTLTF